MIVCGCCDKKASEGILVVGKQIDISPIFICQVCYDNIVMDLSKRSSGLKVLDLLRDKAISNLQKRGGEK